MLHSIYTYLPLTIEQSFLDLWVLVGLITVTLQRLRGWAVPQGPFFIPGLTVER